MRLSTRYLYFFILIFACSCSSQKKISSVNESLTGNLKTHIQFLADDKLEGRRAGSNGEKLAMDYIASQFQAVGLEPKGTNQYFQAFDINEGKVINPASGFSIGNDQLELGKDFFPLPYSANAEIKALPVIHIQETEMPWFFDLKDVLEENKNNPHFDLTGYIYSNAKKVMDRGASAVIIYNTSSLDDKMEFNSKDRSEKLSIPVIYVRKAAALKYFKDESATLDLKLKTDIGEKRRPGHNVAGFINNGAATTVVLGAHYDHLGYGEDGNSMFRTGEKAIHNGADDNASGTAALIELARLLKNSNAKNNNYLFLAFSGEELGLFGSKYFVENPTIGLGSINYMINMDMVGRFNDSTRALTIGGIGTSPVWGEVLKAVTDHPFVYKFDSSGTGPSDHTSFYRKDIPVLFYFTGLHSDYHRPTDDAEKINYQGAARIVQHILSTIEALNDKGRLAFLKTREIAMTNVAFRVTLGIMPDYTYTGAGVRADGVTEGRPAHKAGLKAGDIIIQLGEFKINSMETYMQALGKFKKGDKAKVTYKRGNQTLDAMIEF